MSNSYERRPPMIGYHMSHTGFFMSRNILFSQDFLQLRREKFPIFLSSIAKNLVVFLWGGVESLEQSKSTKLITGTKEELRNPG
jgi:hypothetical protein